MRGSSFGGQTIVFKVVLCCSLHPLITTPLIIPRIARYLCPGCVPSCSSPRTPAQVCVLSRHLLYENIIANAHKVAGDCLQTQATWNKAHNFLVSCCVYKVIEKTSWHGPWSPPPSPNPSGDFNSLLRSGWQVSAVDTFTQYVKEWSRKHG